MSANRQHPASAAVAELRQALTPLLRLHFEDLQSRRLLEIFTLLRRLQPEDVQTAMLCHRVLLRVARENLEQMGFIDDEWAILPRLVHNVIEAHGYDFCRRGLPSPAPDPPGAGHLEVQAAGWERTCPV